MSGHNKGFSGEGKNIYFKQRIFVKHYAPLGTMLLVEFGYLNKIGMKQSETTFQLKVKLTSTD